MVRASAAALAGFVILRRPRTFADVQRKSCGTQRTEKRVRGVGHRGGPGVLHKYPKCGIIMNGGSYATSGNRDRGTPLVLRALSVAERGVRRRTARANVCRKRHDSGPQGN